MKENKNFKLNGHPELVSGSHEILNRAALVQNDVLFQKGRSMVEMLGVLAVMGVLSVGGVAMYTSAMNKHRANEILNEASKRAVMVAGQLLTNPSATTMSLAQFGSNAVAGGTFGENAAIANGKITLTVSGVETAVCNQMKAATGDNTVMTVTGDCGSPLTLTFNTDMSRGVTPGSSYDDNAGAKTCSEATECDTETQTCSGGKCISKCAAGAVWADVTASASNCADGVSSCKCVSVSDNPSCSSSSDCMYGDGCCVDGKCVAQFSWNTCPSTTPTSCSSNAGCDTPDEYCSITSSTWSCSSPDTGSCLPVGTVNTVSGKTGTAAQYNGFVYSSQDMTWWAADNWCKAQGMRLVSLSDLGCTTSNCSDWDTLRAAFGENYFWTVDSSNSCYAFGVGTDDSSVDYGSRYDFIYALCK